MNIGSTSTLLRVNTTLKKDTMIEKNNKYLFFSIKEYNINPDDKKNTGNTNCVELTYPVEADISLPSPQIST